MKHIFANNYISQRKIYTESYGVEFYFMTDNHKCTKIWVQVRTFGFLLNFQCFGGHIDLCA